MAENIHQRIKGRDTYRNDKNIIEEDTKPSDYDSDLSDNDSESKTNSKFNSSLEDTTFLNKTAQWFYLTVHQWLNIKFFLMVLLILVSFLCFNLKHNEEVVSCSYAELRSKYPNESQDVWKTLSAGFDSIIDNKSELGVYLFIHPNLKYATEIVETIATKSSSCFQSDMTPVVMKREDFLKEGDYGHIINQFKQITENTRVVFIGNLNEIPAENARALHYICDTYSPAKKNVVIFLTLVPSSTNGNPRNIAVETLENLWGDKLQRNELDPLIVRVTDDVIQLKGS